MSTMTLQATAASLDLSDDELSAASRKLSNALKDKANHWHANGTSEADILRTLRQIARHFRVELPNKPELKQIINRMADAAWWRRALRKRFRAVEHTAIIAGQVHSKASPYASDSALRRGDRDRRRVAELMAALEAVNQVTGEVLTLAELVEASLANPANRRKAMAVRIRGIEEHAIERGMCALFLTITCPSRMHPRLGLSGQPNPKYDGTSPRQAQAYLCKLWARAMRSLAHCGVQPCGVRVVEPHHDACPHWHVLAFVKPEHEDELTNAVRAYALEDSPDEPGAQAHRFEVKRLDSEVGPAIGYVLKYISKSIDGEGVGMDNETELRGEQAARNIVTWAHTWGIRQFQFFGVPAITPTRELFRANRDSLPSAALQEAHDAAKANDYAAWLRTTGAHGLSFRVDYTQRESARYPGELAARITGLTAMACDLESACQLITRLEEWRIQPRGAAAPNAQDAAPWTRFNNSASPLESTAYELPESTQDRRRRRAPNDLGRRRGRPAKHCPSHPATPPQTMEIAAC